MYKHMHEDMYKHMHKPCLIDQRIKEMTYWLVRQGCIKEMACWSIR